MTKQGNIFVAIDGSDVVKNIKLIESLQEVKLFKVGLAFISTISIPLAVSIAKRYGAKVFVDVKLNDIPEQVANTSCIISGYGADFFTIHALSGYESMRAAVLNKGNAKIFAVTILTSLDGKTLHKLGLSRVSPLWGLNENIKWQLDLYLKNLVIELAKEAKRAGVDGIVCSGDELEYLNQIPELKDLIKVVPGVRPIWAPHDDQKRTITPAEAILRGADYLVIGRPITKSVYLSPFKAYARILEEVRIALQKRKI